VAGYAEAQALRLAVMTARPLRIIHSLQTFMVFPPQSMCIGERPTRGSR
jgi:hypothetical protein